MDPGRRIAAWLTLLGALWTPVAGAGSPGEPLPTGRLIEGIVVASDASQTYTLYLPADYTGQEAWPLLFVMDPRGRGTLAARVFLDGAERYGFILASSNNTRSDGELLPNQEAINRTLPDVVRRVAVRPGHLYLAGMSGTSRVAWMAGHLMGTSVAGVIGSGGATAGRDLRPGAETRFAWFGAAANRDFNYREMLGAHEELIDAGAASRLTFVDGGHAWPPVEAATRALGWMRLQAFRQGRSEMEPELIDGLLASVRSSAAAHEAAGRDLDALLTYRGIVEDFGEVRPTDADDAAIVRLERSPLAIQQRQERHRWSRPEAAYPRRIAAAASTLTTLSPPPPTALLLDELDVEELLAAVEEGPTSEGGLAAARMLSTLYSQMSFYLFRQLHQANEWRRAEIALEIASAIEPGDPGMLYNLACVRARSGRRKKALEALESSIAAGFNDRRLLAEDSDLASLRGTPAFDRVVAIIVGGPGADPASPTADRR